MNKYCFNNERNKTKSPCHAGQEDLEAINSTHDGILLEEFRRLFQLGNNLDVLRADRFALAAGDAFAGLAALTRRKAVARFCARQVVIGLVGVDRREDLRDLDPLGTSLHAVLAVCAGDGGDGGEGRFGLVDDRQLVGGELVEAFHHLQVVLHLLDGGHARQDGDQPVQRGRKPQRPGGNRHVRLRFLKEVGGRLGEVRKAPALDRLHDDDRFAVFAGGFVAEAGLDRIGVPVGVVDLELDELHLRMFGQHLVQRFGRVVHREAEVLDQALFLLLMDKVPDAEVVEDLGTFTAEVVEQVEIKVPGPGPPQGGVEHLLRFLGRLGARPGGELGGQREALTGVAVDDRRLDRLFRFAAEVAVGGVKIGKAGR